MEDCQTLEFILRARTVLSVTPGIEPQWRMVPILYFIPKARELEMRNGFGKVKYRPLQPHNTEFYFIQDFDSRRGISIHTNGEVQVQGEVHTPQIIICGEDNIYKIDGITDQDVNQAKKDRSRLFNTPAIINAYLEMIKGDHGNLFNALKGSARSERNPSAEIPDFNAIVGSSNNDPISLQRHKLIYLKEVSQRTGVLRYKVQPRTDLNLPGYIDYVLMTDNLEIENLRRNPLCRSVSSFQTMEGGVFPENKPTTPWEFEDPGAIYLDDERLFVRQDLATLPKYLDQVAEFCNLHGNTFENQSAQDWYKAQVSLCRKLKP